MKQNGFQIKGVKFPLLQIIGMIISVALILIGVFCNQNWCLSAGVIFGFCMIGNIIGYNLREKSEKNKKLLPAIVLLAVLATIVCVCLIIYL